MNRNQRFFAGFVIFMVCILVVAAISMGGDSKASGTAAGKTPSGGDFVPVTNTIPVDITAKAEPHRPDVDEPTAEKLLKASRAEKLHPGIILRYACQVPSTSTFYQASLKEQNRAERLWDSVIVKELRLEQAEKIQKSLYSGGYRVTVLMRESPYPKLIMHANFFNETTAYVYDSNGTAKSMGEKLLPLGVRSITYDGPDASSSTEWKADDVHQQEYGDMETLCAAVRAGQKSPDSINATVSNPK